MDRSFLERLVAESLELQRGFFDAKAEDVLRAGRMLVDTINSGNKVLAFGNGGSAADAQHFATELVGRYRRDRRAFPAIALTTDTSLLTAVANDLSFDDVFSRQIDALGQAGDLALAISTSGNSKNVLDAVALCRERSVRILGLSGRDGGKLAALCDLCLVVPHQETARIQEIHGMLIHLMCRFVEDSLCPEDG